VIADEQALSEKLEAIFMPFAATKRKQAIDKKLRFVHYTSANAALQIINTKRIWMRSSTCMADYREVLHGQESLRRFFQENPANRARFFEVINGCAEGPKGLAQEAFTLFDQWWSATLLQTYITSTIPKTYTGGYQCGAPSTEVQAESRWFFVCLSRRG
jgi:hypothetical protein